jgi:hypothetical protein
MDLKVVDRPHATENAHRNNLIIVARLPAIHYTVKSDSPARDSSVS